MALVTVSTFANVPQAEMARLALDAEGISAVIADAYGGTILQHVSGGVHLQVDEADVEAADAVLNRLTGVAGAEYATPSDAWPWHPPEACPNCGASDVARRPKLIAFLAFAASVIAIAYTQDATLLGFYIVVAGGIFILVSASWRCRQCGHTW